MQISAYLTFTGNCREAMHFYQQCLGGELSIQTVGESPHFMKMPKAMRNAILHATLINESLILMASDMVPEIGLVSGNAISLMLDCSSEAQIKQCYLDLSTGGTQTHPIQYSYWGSLFGDLIDKYGNHWLLQYQGS
ncbi:MAG: VOC family protein [Saprospiraceae bacterium]|nr:VOC family protein [Saprospiraceae bacterium]